LNDLLVIDWMTISLVRPFSIGRKRTTYLSLSRYCFIQRPTRHYQGIGTLYEWRYHWLSHSL
jgi:hypothetical protein